MDAADDVVRRGEILAGQVDDRDHLVAPAALQRYHFQILSDHPAMTRIAGSDSAVGELRDMQVHQPPMFSSV